MYDKESERLKLAYKDEIQNFALINTAMVKDKTELADIYGVKICRRLKI